MFPPDLLPRSRQIILPLVAGTDEREALLTEAFYLHDPLLYSIERTGAPKVFTIRCIKKLLDYGCLTSGEHALTRLLETARFDVGLDKYAEIDALTGALNALCKDDPAPPRPKPEPDAMPALNAMQTLTTPQTERTPTVFISYSHSNADVAQRLIADLNAAGHACWIDTSAIKGGDEWIMTISEGIINSYAFVPLLSQAALKSVWVRKEILWAVDKRKSVIPLFLERVDEHPFFFLLKDIQGISLLDGDYATALTQLLAVMPSPTLPAVDVTDAELGDSPEPVATTQALRAVPRKLELAYLERLRLEELLSTEKYTAMSGSSEVRPKAEMRAVFELLPMGHEQPRETRRFENAVDEILEIRRCVLLGDPGGGKTTTLWKLADKLVTAALNDRIAPIPLLIRLGKWTDADQSLPDFIASQLGDLGTHLDGLLAEKRAALLLDGLNELPASQHASKYPQVQALIERHPDLLAVVSCRELDYTLDLGFDKITITPLDPLRIREFAGRYLGADKGDDLFWRLAGDKSRERHDAFMEWANEQGIDDVKTIFWLAPKFQHENLNQSWWQAWVQEREGPSALMVLARNPYMLLMLTSVYDREGRLPDNRGELFAQFIDTLAQREIENEVMLPAEHDLLVTGLARVAYEMQVRRAEADADGSNALTVLPEAEVEALLGERLLYLAGSASILSIGEQVRFSHQLLQEYFAAKYMQLEIEAGRLQASDIWPPDRWWERTNWEEATILLAGLYSDDCGPILKWVNQASPLVAAQCVVRSGASVSEASRSTLQSEWIERLTDIEREPDPQSRAAVGRALGLTNWDTRKGVGTIMRDGLRLPDIDWVTIPEGEFTYGGVYVGNGLRKMTLPTFQISRYLVTYAQFQCFVEDDAGYSDPRWREGLAADEKHKQLLEQFFQFWNHPRETVNWYQAMAYCRWLSWRLQALTPNLAPTGRGTYDPMNPATWLVRLPTEFEWEKAARGTDGRKYPYGNEFDANKGNTQETGLRQTSALGIFPQGASPYGVLDMSGNVWEWCLTAYSNPQKRATDEDIRSSARRVLRGGSWNFDRGLARAASRLDRNPSFRSLDYGFRLCCVRAPSL